MNDIATGGEIAASEPIAAPVEAPVTTEAPAQIEQSQPASESGERAAKVPSAREAIQKAFERVERGSDRPRNPDGTFAPLTNEAKPADPLAKAPEKAQDAPKPVEEAKTPEQAAKPLDEPPARFSPDAKAEWAKAPEAIRGEIRRAITELETGIQQHKQRAEAYAPLEQYRAAAEAQGTNLKSVIDNYLSWENTLKSNPIEGFAALAQNMGQNPVALAQTILERAGVAPGDATGQTQIYQQQLAAQSNELAAVRGQLAQMQKAFEQIEIQRANEQIAAIAKDKPGFDALRPVMGRLIETGMAQDLDEAYQMATRLKPDAIPTTPQPAPVVEQPAPAQVTQPTPAPQTRKAVLSVTGAPASGSNPVNRKPPSTPREALQRAFAATGLG